MVICVDRRTPHTTKATVSARIVSAWAVSYVLLRQETFARREQQVDV